MNADFSNVAVLHRALATSFLTQAAMGLLPEKRIEVCLDLKDAIQMLGVQAWIASRTYNSTIPVDQFAEVWIDWAKESISGNDPEMNLFRKRLAVIYAFGESGILSSGGSLKGLHISKDILESPDKSLSKFSRMFNDAWNVVCLSGVHRVLGVSVDFDAMTGNAQTCGGALVRRAVHHLRCGNRGMARRRLVDCVRLFPYQRLAPVLLRAVELVAD